MNDEQYREHCRELLAQFAQTLQQRTEHLAAADPLSDLAQAFTSAAQPDSDLYRQGPPLIDRLFTTYPELAPTLPRQLLWFFGGNCLHYMPDEEIRQFQQLEEMRQRAEAAGEPFNLRDARAKLLNLQ